LHYAAGKNIRFGVLITTDEETTSNGIKALTKTDPLQARIVLDTDAGTLDTLCDKAKHPVTVKITAYGENAHSSRPWNGVNAITNLMACIKNLEQTFPQYAKGGAQPQTIWTDTMTVTAFNSPATYNIVPATAEAWINFRLTEKTSYPDLLAFLETATALNGCSYEVMLHSCGVYMDIANPVLQKYMQCASETIGRPLQIAQMCGGTDARLFADHSTIIMHSINGGNAHGDNEYAEIDSISALAEIQRKFIDMCCLGKVY